MSLFSQKTVNSRTEGIVIRDSDSESSGEPLSKKLGNIQSKKVLEKAASSRKQSVEPAEEIPKSKRKQIEDPKAKPIKKPKIHHEDKAVVLKPEASKDVDVDNIDISSSDDGSFFPSSDLSIFQPPGLLGEGAFYLLLVRDDPPPARRSFSGSRGSLLHEA